MLTLPIKKKWFDMIISGEKKEEYRNPTKYYQTRFQNLWQGSLIGYDAERKIRFRNGYSSDTPSIIATVTLGFGEGKPEWGAVPGKEYYILRIKEIEIEKITTKVCHDGTE